MLIGTIIYDDNAAYWEKRDEYNKAFVDNQFNYLNLKFKASGYLYLNDIYEILGVKWDVGWENTCFIYGDSCVGFEYTMLAFGDLKYKILIETRK